MFKSLYKRTSAREVGMCQVLKLLGREMSQFWKSYFARIWRCEV